MTMQSYPFTSHVTYDAYNNPVYDRAVDADFLRSFHSIERTVGVILSTNANAFKVSADDPASRNVIVGEGHCFINGAYGLNDDDIEKSIATADSTLDRIDSVVLRLDLNDAYRSIDVYVKTGTAAVSPTRPSLTRTDTVYELGIADISVPAASATVLSSHITDTRTEASRCGESITFSGILPISAGGTGASTAAGARSNLGLTKTLLWTNASPTSSFASQNIPIASLSQYSYILIEYQQGTDYGFRYYSLVPVGEYCIMAYEQGTSGSKFSHGWREVGVLGSSNVVEMYAGYYYLIQGGSCLGRVDNSYIIPRKIYGVKEL